MKTLALILIGLAGCLSAQQHDEPAVLDGNRWFATQKEALPVHQLGASLFQRGTIKAPLAWLELKEPIALPPRVIISRDELHQRHMPGFRWAEGVTGDYFIVSERAEGNPNNFNGNFGTGLRNLSFVGGGVAVGGAQISIYENLRIWNAPTVGFKLLNGSTRVSLRDIDVSNHDADDQGNRYGTAIELEGSRSVDCGLLASMGNEIGLDINKSHVVNVGILACEQTKTPLRIRGNSSNITVQLEAQTASSVIADLTQNGGGIRVSGVVRKSPNLEPPGPLFVKAFDGTPVRLFGDLSDNNNGYPFELRTEGFGSNQTLWINGEQRYPEPVVDPGPDFPLEYQVDIQGGTLKLKQVVEDPS